MSLTSMVCSIIPAARALRNMTSSSEDMQPVLTQACDDLDPVEGTFGILN